MQIGIAVSPVDLGSTIAGIIVLSFLIDIAIGYLTNPIFYSRPIGTEKDYIGKFERKKEEDLKSKISNTNTKALGLMGLVFAALSFTFNNFSTYYPSILLLSLAVLFFYTAYQIPLLLKKYRFKMYYQERAFEYGFLSVLLGILLFFISHIKISNLPTSTFIIPVFIVGIGVCIGCYTIYRSFRRDANAVHYHWIKYKKEREGEDQDWGPSTAVLKVTNWINNISHC